MYLLVIVMTGLDVSQIFYFPDFRNNAFSCLLVLNTEDNFAEIHLPDC